MTKKNNGKEDWENLNDKFFQIGESLEDLIAQLPEIDLIAQDYVLAELSKNYKHPVNGNALLFDYFKRKKFNHELYAIFRKYITLLKKEDKYIDTLIDQANGKKKK